MTPLEKARDDLHSAAIGLATAVENGETNLLTAWAIADEAFWRVAEIVGMGEEVKERAKQMKIDFEESSTCQS